VATAVPAVPSVPAAPTTEPANKPEPLTVHAA